MDDTSIVAAIGIIGIVTMVIVYIWAVVQSEKILKNR